MKKLCILHLIVFLIIGFYSPGISTAAENSSKKAVLLVMDYVDTKDLALAQTNNLDRLTAQSGTALMNIRAKNRYPASSYMSIAVGSRVGTINNSELSFNVLEPITHLPNVFKKDEPSYWLAEDLYRLFTGINPPSDGIVNLYTENIRKSALTYNPSYKAGQIGEIAQNNGLAVTVLGNADTIDTLNRNIALLGMNEDGIVFQGDVSSDLLEYDSSAPGGVKTNHDVLLSKIQSFLPLSDLLIVDLGDTTRVEMSRAATADHIVLQQRKTAIEKNDLFLGRLLEHLDLDSTMILIISPNPTKEMISEKNLGLTPVIIYNPTQTEGLLTSSTTRRTGLITNADILPTIFTYLEADFVSAGNSTYIKSTENNSIKQLDQELSLFKSLREARNPLHLLFISLILLTFILGLWINWRKNNKFAYLNILLNAILSIPVLWMFISFTGYPSITCLLFITLGSSLAAAILLHFIFKPLNSLFFITGLTSLLLMWDCFTNSKLMLISPLGSDAIAGGRYYGVGNDFMGILLASSVIFITLLIHHFKLPLYAKASLGSIFLLIISIAIGHPGFGANVGGLITALVTVGTFILIITNRKINVKQLAIVGLLAIIGVVGVAQLDALYSSNPSHAGRAISSLLSGGFPVFYSIIRIKLGILANTFYTSNWSVVMLISIILLTYLWRNFNSQIALLALKIPHLTSCVRILLVSGLTVLFVNDTGVIAAALIFTYTISCLWIGLNEI